jgi:hypothetical protein
VDYHENEDEERPGICGKSSKLRAGISMIPAGHANGSGILSRLEKLRTQQLRRSEALKLAVKTPHYQET